MGRKKGRRRSIDRRQVIAHFAAMGRGPKEISQIVGIKPQSVSNALQDEEMRKMIQQEREKFYAEMSPQVNINRNVPKAVKHMEELLEDQGAPRKLRMAAAKDFMDRGLGKPTQVVEAKGNMVRDLIDLMKTAREGGGRIEQERPDFRDVDSWVDKFEENPNGREENESHEPIGGTKQIIDGRSVEESSKEQADLAGSGTAGAEGAEVRLGETSGPSGKDPEDQFFQRGSEEERRFLEGLSRPSRSAEDPDGYKE